MKFHEKKSGVFFPQAATSLVGTAELQVLSESARQQETGKSRICLHQIESDPVQEMLCCFTREAYLRPHRQMEKQVSYVVLEGSADLLLFSDQGRLNEIIALGNLSNFEQRAIRLPANTYRALLVKTDEFLIHEVTSGPFLDNQTQWATWSPAEQKAGLAFLKHAVQSFNNGD